MILIDDKRHGDCDILFAPQTSEKSTLEAELKSTTCYQITTTTDNNILSRTMLTPTTLYNPAVSFKEDKSSDMITIIGAVIGAALIIIVASVLLIFVLRKR